MKGLLRVLVLLLLFVYGYQPANGRSSPDDLDHLIRQIEHEITHNMQNHDIPGMAFVLVDQEGIRYARGFGILNVHDENAWVDEHTNFKIGSISKVFTALAVMQLQDRGRLDIHDPVTDYLPWFTTRDRSLSDMITIKHLLTHSSGLPDRLNTHDIVSTDRATIQRRLQEKLEHVALVFEPGTAVEYTNMNMDLLQAIIEQTTDEPFHRYMEREIFEPLGMERTGYFDFEDEPLSNTATGHRYHWGSIRPFKDELVYASSGSAGLSTNAIDLGRYIHFLLNEGSTVPGVIEPDSLQDMHRLQIRFPGDTAGYGFGWVVTPTTIEHNGGRAGYTANIILLSDRTYGFALLSNSKQDITDETNYNIYSILHGRTPNVLSPVDYPKTSEAARFVLYITIGTGLILLALISVTIFGLVLGRRTIRWQKPGGWRATGLIFNLLIYGYIMVYLYVYLPRYEIGVPSLYDYQLDPDLTAGFALFTILYTAIFLLLCFRLLLVRKHAARNDMSL